MIEKKLVYFHQRFPSRGEHSYFEKGHNKIQKKNIFFPEKRGNTSKKKGGDITCTGKKGKR